MVDFNELSKNKSVRTTSQPIKKVCVVLVEGRSDEVYISKYLDEFKKESYLNVEILILRGDITTNNASTVYNIKVRIGEFLVSALASTGVTFQLEDISDVVHIIDTDGAFISDDNVFEWSALPRDAVAKSDIVYTESGMYARDVASIRDRNRKKTSIVNILRKTKVLSISKNAVRNKHTSKGKKLKRKIDKSSDSVKLNYRCFYLASNPEHLFHDSLQYHTDLEKTDLSNKFAREYNDRVVLKELICASSEGCYVTWEDSWNYVFEGNNSLTRVTNLMFWEAFDFTKNL